MTPIWLREGVKYMIDQRSMKVLQITGKEKFEFITMPIPDPEEREVHIKRLGIVTCNAFDLNIYNVTVEK
jgi:hypothetical protein